VGGVFPEFMKVTVVQAEYFLAALGGDGETARESPTTVGLTAGTTIFLGDGLRNPTVSDSSASFFRVKKELHLRN
jgi:hypothetical protein